MDFSEEILKWHSGIERHLPWKSTDDAYKIWLSEIILQQTRVAQGLPYYLRFLEKHPDIYSFARADISDILKLWEGLGYYSRARNMHEAARIIVNDYNGAFPKDYHKLLQIKGIGKYTAAAIASFAFHLPHAVVDGNVYRVLSRYFAIDTPIDTTIGNKLFTDLAQQLLPHAHAARYNQAIMDFGALQCVPKSPNCMICPIIDGCKGYASKQISTLPIKSKKLLKKDRHFYYLLVKQGDKILLRQRKGKDIWHLLYELPYIEYTSKVDNKVLEKDILGLFMENISLLHLCITNDIQMLTHQIINGYFSYIEVEENKNMQIEGIWIDKKNIANYAYPKIVKDFLGKYF